MKWVMRNFILFTVLILIAVWAKPVLADSTNDDNDQTNSSGSNTQITGGYTSTTTNNNDGQTNTTTSTTTNNSTTNGSDIPVNSANSPSFSSMSQDVCSMGLSGSVSTLGFGASVGKHVRDLNCERIKLSKVLYDYGMKVAAVSILNKYDIERPDYDSYVSKLENRSRVDEELAEIERQQEAERVAEEKARKEAELKTLKEQEEVDKIIIETDLHTEEVRIINIHE